MTAIHVLHSAALLSPTSGMLSQMSWEQEAANQLGIAWQVKMYCPKNTASTFNILHHDQNVDADKLTSIFGKLTAWLKLRFNYHRWLLEQQDFVDYFILRYYVHDPFQLWFVKKCKKPVYFVHHTLELPELALPGGLTSWMRSRLDQILGRRCIANAAGIVGVTQEIVEYEAARADVRDKPRYIYPNGIVFRQLDLIDERSQDVPELLFVANFSPWHGLDLLLKSIKNSEKKFILHLVGNLPENLIPLIQDARIKVHGSLRHDQIVYLSQRCWVGLASFALFRKQMKQACPLKVREYLLLGLPAYGDYQDVFPSDAIYFRFGTEKIEEILDFAYAVRSLSKDDVANLARPFIDKSALLQGLYNYLQDIQCSRLPSSRHTLRP